MHEQEEFTPRFSEGIYKALPTKQRLLLLDIYQLMQLQKKNTLALSTITQGLDEPARLLQQEALDALFTAQYLEFVNIGREAHCALVPEVAHVVRHMKR